MCPNPPLLPRARQTARISPASHLPSLTIHFCPTAETKVASQGPLGKPAGLCLSQDGCPPSGENVGEQGLDFLTWADLVSTEPTELATQAMIGLRQSSKHLLRESQVPSASACCPAGLRLGRVIQVSSLESLAGAPLPCMFGFR